jgi:hypothetical protein
LISVHAQERTEGFLSADFSVQYRVFSPTLLGAAFLVSVRYASAKPISEVSLPQFVLPVSPAFRFDLIFIALEGERAAWSRSRSLGCSGSCHLGSIVFSFSLPQSAYLDYVWIVLG